MIRICGLMALLIASPALGEPCGGIVLEGGEVATVQKLPPKDALDDTAECVRAIGAALARHKGVRTVTVAVRLDDAARARLDGLKVAELYKKTLAAGGLAAGKISGVVPSIRHGEEDSVLITFTALDLDRPVLAIESMSGDVKVGANADAMRAARPGMTLPVGTVVTVGAKGAVWVALADGSRVRLTAHSELHVEELRYDDDLRRRAKLRLERGDAEVDVRDAAEGSDFIMVTPHGRTEVVGTYFRMNVSKKRRTRLETLAGKVDLAGQGGRTTVAAGQGALVGEDGTPGDVRDLLPAPDIESPKRGSVARPGTLDWTRLNGAGIYKVELARDAEFALDITTLSSKVDQTKTAEQLVAGKWFWRVAGVDPDEFVGMPSRVFAFRLQ